MDIKDYLLPEPKQISGSHFADYLSCKRRLWMNLNLENSIRAKDPAYLVSLQKDGLSFEEEIYKSEDFKGAYLIPNDVSKKERKDLTNRAIANGYSKILQAYFSNGVFIGVADVLEKVHFGKKYYYNVGDIKSSKEIMTYHVFQILFYNELLSEIQGYHSEKGFIILGNKQRIEVDFNDVAAYYQSAKRDILKIRDLSLIDIEKYYPPVLKTACQSCAFRLVCMPNLITRKDISLIPNISHLEKELLLQKGISDYESFTCKEPIKLEEIGLNPDVIHYYIKSANAVKNNLPAFYETLSQKLFNRFLPVALQLNSTTTGLLIEFVYAYNDDQVVEFSSETIKNEIPAIFQSSILLLHGTDYPLFTKFINDAHPSNKLRIFDLLTILERFVHYPFLTLELEELAEQISFTSYKNSSPDKDNKGISRLAALNKVHQWLCEGLKHYD